VQDGQLGVVVFQGVAFQVGGDVLLQREVVPNVVGDAELPARGTPPAATARERAMKQVLPEYSNLPLREVEDLLQ
jgi:hypothetical protein